ncbi:MAG: hypothetical protein P8L85_18350, partial [Rubripirellula sp.]|nr:hypothetical protein [Rubripirellula sp.]
EQLMDSYGNVTLESICFLSADYHPEREAAKSRRLVSRIGMDTRPTNLMPKKTDVSSIIRHI